MDHVEASMLAWRVISQMRACVTVSPEGGEILRAAGQRALDAIEPGIWFCDIAIMPGPTKPVFIGQVTEREPNRFVFVGDDGNVTLETDAEMDARCGGVCVWPDPG